MPYYLGKHCGELTLFHSPRTPTSESHGHLYAAVIGPFHSRLGAHYFARYGRNNPHLRTAADAERLACADPRMDETVAEEGLTAEELAIARECAAEDSFESTSQPNLMDEIRQEATQPKE
ncbi:MAG: hypothetical protein HYZ25_15890 [Chloroflexi bacterium]|nr:hypothetical protein [Chloroflexota bacterium]